MTLWAGSNLLLTYTLGHSLSDLLSDGVTLWAVRLARLPPDDDHPYGHGRFEVWHHRSDALSSIVAWVGIVGARVRTLPLPLRAILYRGVGGHCRR